MKMNFKRFLSFALALVLVIGLMPISLVHAEETATLPDATVTELAPTTLKAGEYNVWTGSGSPQEGTEDLPLQVVVNFKANDTYEEAVAGGYGDWLPDFYLTFTGLAEGKITADNCYLAGNYGDFGWIAIPTDDLELEAGVSYPVVSTVIENLTYADICNDVKEFTAAIYVDPAILEANPDFSVSLQLKMTDPEDENNVLEIGKPLVYDECKLLGIPDATVTKLDPMTLAAGEYSVWQGDSNLANGAEALPLQAVVNFKANDTLEECLAGDYSKWLVDFYLTFEGLPADGIMAEDSYLVGNYGSFGWIAIPTDTITIENGVEYPVVSNYDPTLNYKDICNSVKDFTAALYVSPEILEANPGFKVTLKLKMTDPENENNVLEIGKPQVYNAKDLLYAIHPDATVTKLDPMTLAAGEYNVWTGSLTAGTEDLPLQAVVNFKANDTLEECLAGGYSKWLVDFYLTFEGLPADGIMAVDSYLAGNYGSFGWIAIPTDEVLIKNGVEYPVVSNYDHTLNYKDICNSVKDFTAALYVSPEILEANPGFKVTLKLKMTDPENENNVLEIGKPQVYTAKDLLYAIHPDATVTELDPMTLAAGEYNVWTGSLTAGTEDLPLQAVVNFKANDTLEECLAGGYSKWLVDFYLTFEGLPAGGIMAEDSYLAGNYGSFGWIAIPTDEVLIKNGVEYPVVSNYDPSLNYKDICNSVKDFTAALYVSPEILEANPGFKVTLKLKMTDPENENNVLQIDDPVVYTAEQLLAMTTAVAKNVETGKFYTTIAAALDEAKPGETVIVLRDTQEKSVTVFNGVTLDLNGKTVTATHVSAFQGNYIIDSTNGSGLLKVGKGYVVLQKNNPYLPIYNGTDGYVFTSVVKFQQKDNKPEEDVVKYMFLPQMNPDIHDLLAAGSATSGVELKVEVSWIRSDGKMATQTFAYTDDMVQQVVNSYENGRYALAYTLDLYGVPEGKALTFRVIYTSTTGAVVACAETTN